MVPDLFIGIQVDSGEENMRAGVRPPLALLDETTRSIMLLLVLTGLRVGELLALRWGNIDIKARMLRVCETVYEGHFDRPKTKRSVRTIPIGKETAEILGKLRTALSQPTALVFATREGLPLDRRNLLRKHLKPAAKKLGLTGVTWHLLRHCYATMLTEWARPWGRCNRCSAIPHRKSRARFICTRYRKSNAARLRVSRT
jgi:integrase